MHVWEIIINLDHNDYEEVASVEIQENYHAFINKILSSHDTFFLAHYPENKVIFEYGATTLEKLNEIIDEHIEIYRNLKLREKPLDINYRIYEL
jgi:hypothetical protein